MAIQVLDQDTINKIAAGEVIERPASIVKELVENAIDAKATAITVEIKEGGISLIRITDNGCGIKANELPLAFLRHSTSKIKSVEDLMNVSSLGFRGEALSSIAAVAQVELITKVSDALTGNRYVIEGGKEISNDEIGAPDGTTFIVRNIFFNTPVRRKFLKSAATEAGYVSALIERISLSHPEISFRFISNNQNKLHTSGNMQLRDIVYNIYGKDITKNLVEIDAITQDVHITGFIGKPSISRGNRTYENYFVNGRYIKSGVITKAIEEAYKGFIMMHNYPFTALHFEINPNILDVNVHPTKMELRFSKNDFVQQFVFNTVRDALTRRELIPEVKVIEKEQIISNNNEVTQLAGEFSIDRNENKQLKERLPEPFELKRSKELLAEDIVQYDEIKKEITPSVKTEQLNLFKDDSNRVAKKNYKLIGQLFSTYWLIEFEDKFYMMDQHAAHEKILYEKILEKIKNNQMATQYIMPSVVISLNMTESKIFNENKKIFTELGFEVEEFGPDAIKITGVPASFPKMDYKKMFLEMLDSMIKDDVSSDLQILTEKVASMACKAAIKGNNSISYEEAQVLMNDLMSAENPYNCPHGRPTLIMMSKYEIDKKFHRIV